MGFCPSIEAQTCWPTDQPQHGPIRGLLLAGRTTAPSATTVKCKPMRCSTLSSFVHLQKDDAPIIETGNTQFS